jgi:hypothetical protein
MFDINDIFDIGLPGGAGIWAARWGVKLAGEIDAEGPGFEHAIAILIAANFGGNMIGQVLGDSRKADYARIGALSWGTDLFARKRFFKDAEWVEKNLYLGAIDDDETDAELEDDYDEDVEDYELDGLQESSALGQNVFRDAVGNMYMLTRDGYVPVQVGADGNVYRLSGGVGQYSYPNNYNQIAAEAGQVKPDPAITAVQYPGMDGLQQRSALGARPDRASSFGYSV